MSLKNSTEFFHFKSIIEKAHTAIFSVDENGKIVVFNPGAEKITGIKAENAIGKDSSEIPFVDGVTRVSISGKPQIGLRVEIGEKTVLTNRTPIIKNGKIVGAMAIFQDITELEKLSRELEYVKALNEELDTIIESVSDGLYITDGEGTTLRVNSAYERISGGVKAEEVIGRNMKDLVQEGYYSKSVTLIVLEKKEPVSILHTIKGDKEVLITGNPVFDENGKIVRVVTTVRDIVELNTIKKELAKTIAESKRYKKELETLKEFQNQIAEVVATSKIMKDVVDLAFRVGKVRSTVLITGESGVGKEVVARVIHNSSNIEKPIVKLNCGAIPENLLESELFGYEEGAFTGAVKGGKPGLFEIAHNGSVFLDEIGELPLPLQVKLLRVIQEKEILRVGGVTPIKVDVRIIAATNKNLEKMVSIGKFREDLFYRLSVIPIEVPPLRKRPEDIIPLAVKFLEKFNSMFHTEKEITPDALKALETHLWPGNVRELENNIERLVILSPGEKIMAKDINEIISSIESRHNPSEISIPDIIPIESAVNEVEKQLLTRALKKYKTTRKAAAVLGISQPSVVRKIKKYDIQI